MNSQKLIDLYAKQSKHSQYQILARRLRSIIPVDAASLRSRYEQERLDYIVERICVQDRTVVDIGANTGFFSVEMIENGAREVFCYEGNEVHADFIRETAKVLGVEDRLHVQSQYIDFNTDMTSLSADIMILMNVLHHVGDDYGEKELSRDFVLNAIARTLDRLSAVVGCLIFQLGYNWKGNVSLPLFQKGTKGEMVDFIRAVTANRWKIIHIGVPSRITSNIRYVEVNRDNIIRDDDLGEFLNRPLFILESQVCHQAHSDILFGS